MNQDEPSIARTPPADGEKGAAIRSGISGRSDTPRAFRAFVERHTPKLVVCLREGYDARMFVGDVVAGLTVAVVALPLAMALGIASIPASVAVDIKAAYPWLTPPAIGLYTAVVAGLLIAVLGGSRVQIGGPTAAFVPIVFGIAERHGFEGLSTATLMAGVILVLMGFFRFGTMIKLIPYPVTTGFTAGIAVTIAASQIKDFFGLSITHPDGSPRSVPAEFVPKLQVIAQHLSTANWHAIGVAAGSLAVLIALRRWIPKMPGSIVAVGLGALVVWALGLDASSGGTVETIGSRFGGLPGSIPPPHIPTLNFGLIRDLIPEATTLALLCAIESLLSAVVADGMTGYRHRSDQELVAQGAANIGSIFFFGLPVVGAVARTVTNIKAGARSPIAGIVHSLVILAFMLTLAPLAARVPLASLSAVLLMVAWNIAPIGAFRALLRTPGSDVLVLLTTFGLTVFTDLTIAVGVGMVLASMLFMRRMAEISNIGAITADLGANDPEIADKKDPSAFRTSNVPPGVEVFEINGPFFFGVADRLKDALGQFQRPPKVFILRMRAVPHIDATGLHALEEFRLKCLRQGVRLLLGGVHAQPMFAFVKTGFDQKIGVENIFETLEEALAKAREIIAPAAVPPQPPTSSPDA